MAGKIVEQHFASFDEEALPAVREFAESLFRGVLENREEIDETKVIVINDAEGNDIGVVDQVTLLKGIQGGKA